MEQTIEIRAAVEADVPAITEIYGQDVLSNVSSWELTPPDQAEMRRRFRDLQVQNYPYLVAVRDDRVLGYAFASAYRPRPAYRYTVENTIYLRPDARGQGISQSLLRHLIDACTDAGFRQMLAVIGDSNNQPSIRFHEKMGFRHAALLADIGWKFERWLDGVVMQLPLGEGGNTPPKDTETVG